MEQEERNYQTVQPFSKNSLMNKNQIEIEEYLNNEIYVNKTKFLE